LHDGFGFQKADQELEALLVLGRFEASIEAAPRSQAQRPSAARQARAIQEAPPRALTEALARA
jgi:hypothetical protein